MSDRDPDTLVYSCSGCSNVAQLANHIAVRLDREGLAEMSCIAGVGGDVPSLVRDATSGRPVVVIDGCPLACCERVLAAKDVKPDHVVRLHEYGLKKRKRTDFEAADRDRVYERVTKDLAPLLARSVSPARGAAAS